MSLEEILAAGLGLLLAGIVGILLMFYYRRWLAEGWEVPELKPVMVKSTILSDDDLWQMMVPEGGVALTSGIITPNEAAIFGSRGDGMFMPTVVVDRRGD